MSASKDFPMSARPSTKGIRALLLLRGLVRGLVRIFLLAILSEMTLLFHDGHVGFLVIRLTGAASRGGGVEDAEKGG